MAPFRAVVAALWLAIGLPPCGPATAQDSGNDFARPTSPKHAAPPPKSLPSPSDRRRRRLEAVHSWGYQLRLMRFPEIAAGPHDLVVIDHALSAGRRFVHQFAPELIELAKSRSHGPPRIVLAYLSIGEAERYRFYWDQAWYDPARKPAWLGAANEVWEGNYLVRFWDPDWQRLILDGPDSYLGRILAAGFDGVYLDRADVHADWSKEKPDAAALMSAFVRRIATAARSVDPQFLVVMQNAEELVRQKSLLEVIDGIAKEDLFYGIDHKASANDAETVGEALGHLRTARRSGKRVLVVEYLDDPAKIAVARRRAAAEGFLLHVTGRDLGEMSVDPPPQPEPGGGRHPQSERRQP